RDRLRRARGQSPLELPDRRLDLGCADDGDDWRQAARPGRVGLDALCVWPAGTRELMRRTSTLSVEGGAGGLIRGSSVTPRADPANAGSYEGLGCQVP